MAECFRQKREDVCCESYIRNFENTKLVEWNRLPGAQNRADRGMRAIEIATSLWLNGPAWLRDIEDQWPEATPQRPIVEDKLEKTQLVALLPNKPLEIQRERFTSWTNLVPNICYILRWRSPNQLKGPVSLDEYQTAEQMVIKMVQKEAFLTEIETVTKNKERSSKSSIAQLCPFIDDKGIMRARGLIIQSGFRVRYKTSIFSAIKTP